MTTPNQLTQTGVPGAQPIQTGAFFDDPAIGTGDEHAYSIPDNLLPKPAAGAPQTTAPSPAPAPFVAPVAAAATAPQPAPVPAPATTPAATQTTAAATPQSKHPEWLIQHTTALGVHPLMVERLSTDDLTRVVMDEMARVRTEAARGAAERSQAVPGMPSQQQFAVGQQSPGAQPVAPLPPPEPAFDWGEHEDDDGMGGKVKKKYTEEMIDPALAHHVKSLYKKITNLEGALQSISQAATQSQEVQVQRQFDVAFDAIPQVFGVGTAQSLKGTPEYQRRHVVYQSVKGMLTNMPKEARAGMTIDAAVKIMTKSLFGVDAPGAAQQQPQAQPRPQSGAAAAASQTWGQSALAVPTQRQPAPKPPGREAATDAVAEFLAANVGGNGAMDGDTTLGEFFG